MVANHLYPSPIPTGWEIIAYTIVRLAKGNIYFAFARRKSEFYIFYPTCCYAYIGLGYICFSSKKNRQNSEMNFAGFYLSLNLNFYKINNKFILRQVVQ